MKTRKLILLFAAALMMLAAGCKKEEKPGQLESIRFKQGSYTIAENYLDLNLRKELETVPADIINTNKIEWEVSDESIATMNGSFLEPKRDGNITVTASIQGKSATCNVTITIVPIQDFELEDFSVPIKGTAKTPLTTVPGDISRERFTWEVSDKTIATIDQSGIVKGLYEGVVVVFATANGISKTCILKVKEVPVESIILSKSSIEFIKLGYYEHLTATILPEEAAYHTVTWSSSNTSVATVANDFVTCKGYGNAVITAKAGGKEAKCEVESFEGIKDCQGNTYRTVKIGAQTWMAENLKCSRYDENSERPWEPLPEFDSPGSVLDPYYVDVTKLKPTYESMTPKQLSKLGYAYTWAAAVGFATEEEAKKQTEEFSERRQGICPDGWHLPTSSEWRTLAEEIGGSFDSYGDYPDIGEKLKTKSGWKINNGTDNYSFSVLPAGAGTRISIGDEALFWTAKAYNTNYAIATYIFNSTNPDYLKIQQWHKRGAYSVRCVKN